ncbi:hypothetical protein VRRI112168_20590 [Vreelandella rituensis]
MSTTCGSIEGFQGRGDFLNVIGVLAQVLTHDHLMVTVDANLAVVAVLKVTLLTHDTSIGVGKADLLLVVNDLPRIKGFFASFQCGSGCLHLFLSLLLMC